jgi:aspartyl-tRNA(Asn)/glutamyl-tRNA(Gln) amidotransferase subunit B
VERAIAYEIQRQSALYEAHTPPVEATRGWDDAQGKTIEQRTKESSADYRYFPEPDLPPQDLREIREMMQRRLPELPAQTRLRLMEEFGFSKANAAFFTANDGYVEYVEQIMSELAGWIESADDQIKSGDQALEDNKEVFAKLVGGWLTSKLAGLLAEKNLTIKEANIDPENFAEFIHLLEQKAVNSTNGQKLLQLMHETGGDPSNLMETHNLGQNMDEDQLIEAVKRNLEANPDKVAEIKAGKMPLIKWFVGLVMRDTEGRADPMKVETEIRKQLDV